MSCKLIYNEHQKAIGHICSKCGAIGRWPTYVFSHPDIELTFICAGCRHEVIIFQNIVKEVE